MAFRRNIAALALLTALAAARADGALVVPEVLAAPVWCDSLLAAALRANPGERAIPLSANCSSEDGFLPLLPDGDAPSPAHPHVHPFLTSDLGAFGVPTTSSSPSAGPNPAAIPGSASIPPPETRGSAILADGRIVLPAGPLFELLRPA